MYAIASWTKTTSRSDTEAQGPHVAENELAARIQRPAQGQHLRRDSPRACTRSARQVATRCSRRPSRGRAACAHPERPRPQARGTARLPPRSPRGAVSRWNQGSEVAVEAHRLDYPARSKTTSAASTNASALRPETRPIARREAAELGALAPATVARREMRTEPARPDPSTRVAPRSSRNDRAREAPRTTATRARAPAVRPIATSRSSPSSAYAHGDVDVRPDRCPS